MSQLPSSTFVLTDPIEIVRALVGLKEVRVLAYTRNGPDVELVIEQVVGQIRCPACGERAQVKERPVVRYVDLPVYGTPMSLAWKKHRMRYANASCPKRSWMLGDHRIAAKNCPLTTRAAKWATLQVGTGRTVKEVAGELACDWHTVNDAVTTYGKALLEADRKRMNKTSAIGLDETKFVKLGPHAHSDYATTVVDVEHHQIIDVLPSGTYVDVAAWLDKQPRPGRSGSTSGPSTCPTPMQRCTRSSCPKPIRWSTPSMRSHWPTDASTAVRRRVQNEQTGHRGRRDDPLYRARRVLLRGEETLDDKATERLWSLFELGDPGAEVAIAYRIKERLRDFYATSDPDVARQLLEEFKDHCLKKAMPPEVHKLGRTISKWFAKLCNYHLARVSNGPTKALNNLIKRIKRIGFGFRNFENYRIRALLYAGKPNWRVLGSIVVR
ncbi:MAG: transposase [Actinobacteria bacterium]|nr:transposase [Actinomycetota bacterium]